MNIQQLQDEIRNLEMRIDDLGTEVKVYNKLQQWEKSAECGTEIIRIGKQIKLRKRHLQDQKNFERIITDLKQRGILCEAVKRVAENV